MKDLFKNYHKHKVLANLSVVGVSLVLAISVNMLLVWNQSANLLKANVLEATNISNKADIELTHSESSISVISHQDMNNITELSFSLAYNSDGLQLDDIISEYTSNISNIENDAWLKNIIITFDQATTINAGSILLKISSQKKTEETSYINVINANFKDSSEDTYLLTTSWLVF